jgi:hypothetical protein
MINYNDFTDNFETLELNFNFKYPAKLAVAVYEKIKDLSQEEFKKSINKILAMTQEDWNKKYGFGGKPAIADWLFFFTGNKAQTPERQAIIEVARILDYASYYLGNDVVFDNPFTNAAVKAYGGITKVAWDINKDNETKRPSEWVVKELKDFWLASCDGNKGSNEKCAGRLQPEFFSGGKFVRKQNELDYVGDKESCLMLMDKTETKAVNLEAQHKSNEIVTRLANGFKKI